MVRIAVSLLLMKFFLYGLLLEAQQDQNLTRASLQWLERLPIKVPADECAHHQAPLAQTSPLNLFCRSLQANLR